MKILFNIIALILALMVVEPAKAEWRAYHETTEFAVVQSRKQIVSHQVVRWGSMPNINVQSVNLVTPVEPASDLKLLTYPECPRYLLFRMLLI